MFNGIPRSYRIHLPKPLPPGPLPLVFSLHGLGSNALEQEFYTQFSPMSDSAGFIVVYPDGVNGLWDIGIFALPTNDVGFLTSLIDTIATRHSIDPNRVYSTGFSMGGFMSYRLACEASDRFAAIAPVSGLMADGLYGTCQPDRPVPVLHIHGDADNVVPVGGALGYQGLDTLMAFWRSVNSCPPVADTFYLPDAVANDSSFCIRYTYAPCEDSTEMVLWKVVGGEHTWPGAFPLPNLITNFDLRATRTVWDFFSKHRHPNPSPLATANEPLNPVEQPFWWDTQSGRVYFQGQGQVSLDVWDVNGRLVWKASGWPGENIPFTGSGYAQGLFFVQWRQGESSGLSKVVWK